jgi:hypothetical protein
MVGWLGDRAGSRARRWPPGGGRRDTGSGEPAARAGQQASAGATGGPSGVRTARVCEEKQAGWSSLSGTHGGRRRQGACVRRGGGRFYSRAQGGEGGFLACQGNQVMVWSGYGGMGGDARRPIANQGRRCARTAATLLGGRRGRCEHVAHMERVEMMVQRGQPHDARTGGW